MRSFHHEHPHAHATPRLRHHCRYGAIILDAVYLHADVDHSSLQYPTHLEVRSAFDHG